MSAIRSITAVSAIVILSQGVALSAPRPVEKLEDPHFKAILFTPTGRFEHEMAASYGEFSLAGPNTDSFRPLPKRIRHVTFDPAAKQLYGLSNHEFYRVDLEKNEAVEMKIPAELEKLSWPCGIAFDTRRERVVLVSLGGVGHMYAYTPKTDKWELLGDLNRVDLSGFTYDAKADRFYGLFRPFGSDSKPRVAVYSPKGAIVDSIELSDSNIPKALGSDGVRKATQLVVKSGKLAIITEDSIYALDLGSKKVNVTWTRK